MSSDDVGIRIPHRWSFPIDMQRAYAFLFQTIDTLRVQMSADLWRLVYDSVAGRDRAATWTRELTYTRQHLFAAEQQDRDNYAQRLEELRANDDGLDAVHVDEAVRLQEKHVRALHVKIARDRVMAFEPPTRIEDAATGSSFEVQTDSDYCSVHALNNIARSVLFTPPDVLSAIECTRNLVVRCAAPEDVQLMALREGVVLLQLKLSDIDDTDQLTDGACFSSMLERAGGMLVYQPSGYGIGHYVSLVRICEQWLIFSTSAVLVRSSSASDALHTYIAHTNNITTDSGQTARQARLAATAVAADSDRPPFIGLLPLALDCFWAKPGAAGGVAADALIGETILMRTLLRRALSEWHLRVANDGAVHRDIWTATPLSPCAIEELAWVIRHQPESGTARCTGFETINPASFIASRHAVYRELNRISEELIHQIRRNKYGEAVLTLKQLRSYLLASPAIDCLFGAASSDASAATDGFEMAGVEVQGDYAYALMSNRRWLRLVALQLATSTLLAQIEQHDNNKLTATTLRVVVLVAILAHVNMAAYGVPVPRELGVTLAAHSTADFWRASLPCDSMPKVIADAYMSRPTGLIELCQQVSYDASIWLLQSVASFSAFPLDADLFAALRAPTDTASAADDNRTGTDQRCALVAALRATLFQLPLLGSDSDVVGVALREQWCFETEELAQFNRALISAFVTRCVAICGLTRLGTKIAASAIDVFAFDAAYIDDTTRERASHEDDIRPRYLERAARSGFAHIHRRSFGRVDSHFDVRERAPVGVCNSARVEMPQAPGVWYSARVRDDAASRLAVAPLTHLELYHDSDLSPLDPGDYEDGH